MDEMVAKRSRVPRRLIGIGVLSQICQPENHGLSLSRGWRSLATRTAQFSSCAQGERVAGVLLRGAAELLSEPLALGSGAW